MHFLSLTNIMPSAFWISGWCIFTLFTSAFLVFIFCLWLFYERSLASIPIRLMGFISWFNLEVCFHKIIEPCTRSSERESPRAYTASRASITKNTIQWPEKMFEFTGGCSQDPLMCHAFTLLLAQKFKNFLFWESSFMAMSSDRSRSEWVLTVSPGDLRLVVSRYPWVSMCVENQARRLNCTD